MREAPRAERKWLVHGQQTDATDPEFLKLAARVKQAKSFFPAIEAVQRIVFMLGEKNPDEFVIHRGEKKVKFNEEAFRTQGTPHLIAGGAAWGCSPAAVIAGALLREAGIPAKYVEYIDLNSDRSGEGDRSFGGHAFLKVFHPTRGWVHYDPINRILSATAGPILKPIVQEKNMDLRKAGEGLDSHGIGIRNHQDWWKAFQALKAKEKKE